MEKSGRAPVPTEKGKDTWQKCRHSGRCGSCQLLRMPYGAQLRWKQEKVEECMGDICHVSLIRGMDSPLYYRNKVHAVLSTDKSGKPVSGNYEPGTHRVVPTRQCLLENRRASEMIRAFVERLPGYRLKIYNEYTGRGLLRHVLVRISEKTGQAMFTLVATDLEFPHQKEMVRDLTEAFPEIRSVVINLNRRRTSAVLGTQQKILYGDGYIEDELCGKRFRISSRSFYQVNSRQTEQLYLTAIDLADPKGNELFVDAYCGTGTIGLCAADRVHRMIGIEMNVQAVQDARGNAEMNHIRNAEFLSGEAGKVLERLCSQRIIPDIVMMDPPRSGSTDLFLQTLRRIQPDRIVYVSCNPETLRRDVDVLRTGGLYGIEECVPFDMFPFTEHVETVVALSHQNAQ